MISSSSFTLFFFKMTFDLSFFATSEWKDAQEFSAFAFKNNQNHLDVLVTMSSKNRNLNQKIPKKLLEPPNRKWAKTQTHIEGPWIGVPNWFWWLGCWGEICVPKWLVLTFMHHSSWAVWTLEKIPWLWSTELFPFQNIMLYQWRPKDMGWHRISISVTWGGLLSQRQNRWKTPTDQSSQRRVSKSLCFSFNRINPKFCEKKTVGKHQLTLRNLSLVLVFKQWIPHDLRGFLGELCRFVEDVTHIYATNVGAGGQSMGLPCKPRLRKAWRISDMWRWNEWAISLVSVQVSSTWCHSSLRKETGALSL